MILRNILNGNERKLTKNEKSDNELRKRRKIFGEKK